MLCLLGLPTSDPLEALKVLPGSQTAGFSATTISQIVQVRQQDYQVWREQSLKGDEFGCLWADGTYFNVRLEKDLPAC